MAMRNLTCGLNVLIHYLALLKDYHSKISHLKAGVSDLSCRVFFQQSSRSPNLMFDQLIKQVESGELLLVRNEIL